MEDKKYYVNRGRKTQNPGAKGRTRATKGTSESPRGKPEARDQSRKIAYVLGMGVHALSPNPGGEARQKKEENGNAAESHQRHDCGNNHLAKE